MNRTWKLSGARRVVVVLQMPQEHQVADAIQFGIGTQNAHRTIQVAQLHGIVYIGQHLLQP